MATRKGLLAGLALTAMLLAGCGGGDHHATVEATLRQYLNTVGPEHSGFPAGPPRVKENSCKKIGAPGHLTLWSCVVRFGHTPFHVRVALRDNDKIAWTRVMPRHVLKPHP